MTDSNDSLAKYRALVESHCSMAAKEFEAAVGDSSLQRRAVCRYFKRGFAAGLTTGELVDFLGVSARSVLDLAGYSDVDCDTVWKILGQVSEEEIQLEPI